MATGNKLFDITPVQLNPEPELGAIGQNSLVYNGLAKALSFPSTVNAGAVAIFRMPDTASLATGATVKLLISDDANNPIVNKPVVLGVTFSKLGASASYYGPTTAGLGTETTATVVMPATSGMALPVSIAVAVADMAGLAASTWCMIRLRRLGANAADTGGPSGRVLLLGVAVTDT